MGMNNARGRETPCQVQTENSAEMLVPVTGKVQMDVSNQPAGRAGLSQRVDDRSS